MRHVSLLGRRVQPALAIERHRDRREQLAAEIVAADHAIDPTRSRDLRPRPAHAQGQSPPRWSPGRASTLPDPEPLRPVTVKSPTPSPAPFDFARPEATLQLIRIPRRATTPEFDDAAPSESTSPANSPKTDLTNRNFTEMIDCVHGAKQATNASFMEWKSRDRTCPDLGGRPGDLPMKGDGCWHGRSRGVRDESSSRVGIQGGADSSRRVAEGRGRDAGEDRSGGRMAPGRSNGGTRVGSP